MPYSTPAKKYLRESQKRQEAILSKKYCCSKCGYPFESRFHLKRHEKSCTMILNTGNVTAMTSSTPEVIQGDSAILESNVEGILPIVQVDSTLHTNQESCALSQNQADYTPSSSRVLARVSVNCKPSSTSLPIIRHSLSQNDKYQARLDENEILKEGNLKSSDCTDTPLPDNPAPYDFEITSSQLEE